MSLIAPRHYLPDTPAVSDALAQLSAEVGADEFTLDELVVLGAEQWLKRKRLADMIRNREAADSMTPEEFDARRRWMWIRDFD